MYASRRRCRPIRALGVRTAAIGPRFPEASRPVPDATRHCRAGQQAESGCSSQPQTPKKGGGSRPLSFWGAIELKRQDGC